MIIAADLSAEQAGSSSVELIDIGSAHAARPRRDDQGSPSALTPWSTKEVARQRTRRQRCGDLVEELTGLAGRLPNGCPSWRPGPLAGLARPGLEPASPTALPAARSARARSATCRHTRPGRPHYVRRDAHNRRDRICRCGITVSYHRFIVPAVHRFGPCRDAPRCFTVNPSPPQLSRSDMYTMRR